MSGDLTPFVGLEDTGSGAQIIGEGRYYRSFLEEDRLTFAGRARVGTVVGPEILETPPDYLFFSGGGGSVRGQPYESLGFDKPLPDQDEDAYVGGQSIVNANLEIRYRVRENIGAVAFVDAAQIWDEGAWQGEEKWHAGAGIGVRYNTPIGPIRFDINTIPRMRMTMSAAFSFISDWGRRSDGAACDPVAGVYPAAPYVAGAGYVG